MTCFEFNRKYNITEYSMKSTPLEFDRDGGLIELQESKQMDEMNYQVSDKETGEVIVTYEQVNEDQFIDNIIDDFNLNI